MTFLIIFALVILSLFTTSVFFMMVYSMTSRRYRVSRQFKGELVRSESYSLSEIQTIEIQCYQEDVFFVQSDTEELILNQYRSNRADDGEFGNVVTEGDTLIIKGKPSPIPNSKKYYRREEICIPSSYSGKLNVMIESGNLCSEVELNVEELIINGENGDITLQAVKANRVEVTTKSGLVMAERVDAKRVFRSASGYIKISAGEGDSYVHSISGGITLINTSGILNVNTESGGLLISSLNGGGEITTNTGRIDYTLHKAIEALSVHSNSGDISVQLKEDADCRVEVESEHGRIDTFFEKQYIKSEKGIMVTGMVGANPSHGLQISSTSGDINVKQY